MPRAASPASEVFPCKLNRVLEGFPDIKIVADNVLIIRERDDKEEGRQDPDTKLWQLLNRNQEWNTRQNADKLK